MRAMRALLLTCLVSVPTYGATFTVNSTADEVDNNPGDGVCATAGGTCTLRAAVQEANALAGVDTIDLPAGTFLLQLTGIGEDLAATGDLDITEGLTINGAGSDATIIDGLGADRIFHVIAVDVQFNNVALINGDPGTAAGGAINHTGGASNMTLANVRVAGNRAGLGGGLHHNAGALTVQGCRFEDNNGSGGGGGIFKVNTGQMSISDSQFVSNSTTGPGGAVFYTNLGADDVNIANSTFSQNDAFADGGAVSVVSGSGSLTISGSLFEFSLAFSTGGAVSYNGSMNVTLTDCRFISNTTISVGGGCFVATGAGNFNISGSQFTDNFASSQGGGVFHSGGGGMAVENSEFVGNTAATSIGGGIFSSLSGPFSLSNVDIMDNECGPGGGGGAFVGGPSSATISNSRFMGNTAASGTGGGLSHGGPGAIDITNSTFADNTIGGSGLGGGISNTSGGILTMSGCTLSGNRANGLGALGGGLFNSSAGTSEATNTTFSGNIAGVQGGGVFAASNITFTNCTLAENSATDGSAVFNPAFVVSLRNSILANNAGPSNCGGAAFTSLGHNIDDDATCALAGLNDQSGVDPLLGPLAGNGGPTQTHALLGGSPAIDAGQAAGAPAQDQRGIARPLDGNGDGTADFDIGATEFLDCNGNGQDDAAEIANGVTPDCDSNGVPDDCQSPDSDGDGTYDICDDCTDTDGDGFGDPGFANNTCAEDNCPDISNADQADANGNGVGDLCEPPPAAQPAGDCCGNGMDGMMLMPMTLLGIGWMRRRRLRRHRHARVADTR